MSHYRRDHWANLKDLFININPLKADCYFVHMYRRIDSSSSRSDPSANGYINLDYSARLHLALQRRCTAVADLDDLVQLRLVPQCPRAAAMSSTTSTSREGSAARWRSLRLREDDRRPADDYFDYSSGLETSRGRASQQQPHQLLTST
jgi:hypothetical protein